MKILIIGSGGREHSLVWAFLQNPKCKEIHCIPGNAGIEKIAICKDLNILNNREIVSYCKSNKIDFVVVGPEAPLANGLIDILIQNKILCFGPTKEAALLESSKSFTKSICDKRNIPTANYVIANSKKEALGFIEKFKPPFVIKLDGLAAGKGVLIINNLNISTMIWGPPGIGKSSIVSSAAEKAGIKRSDIIVDPGIGFGKNLKHNLELLGRLNEFKGIAGGVLLGASRKSFIAMMTGNEDGDRLTGSLSAAIMGATGGIDILRVHDVKETRKTIDTINALN